MKTRMTTVSQLSEIPYLKNSVVTVGTFDGVHLAHQQLLRDVVDRAHARKGRSVVLTFEPHPKEVLTGVPMQLLTSLEERQQICEQLGAVLHDLQDVLRFDVLVDVERGLQPIAHGSCLS